MKTCNTCGTDKPVDQFGLRAASKDGLSAKCKQCQKEYDKKRANAPHRVASRKAYIRTETGKAAHNKATKKWLDNNSKKRQAHIAVGNAIRDGKLKREEKCQLCDCGVNLEAHHDDYAYPMIVRWLCPACHNKWHKENGEGANAS